MRIKKYVSFKGASLVAILFSSLLLPTQYATAYPKFLQQFQNAYPSSDTGDADCATCHADMSGGRPWNAYGRDLKVNGGSVGANGNIQSALNAVESLNSDAIAGDNLAEILAGTQPGWCDTSTAGCSNQTYNSDGSNAGSGVPPANLILDDDEVAVPEPNILLPQQSLDFGPVLIGDSKSLNLNIVNTGQLDLTLATSISGVLFAIQTPPANNVPGGGSTSMTVSYSPLSDSVDNGTLTINSNDPDSPTLEVSLAGSGSFDPPTPEGECPVGNQLIDPIPSPIDTGGIAVGLQTIAVGFVNPLLGTAPEGEHRRLFVVDQPGQMWAVDLATGNKSLFLDLSSRLVELGLFGIDYDERGFLGAAFAPDYFKSGLLYTYQSEPVSQPADFSTMPVDVEPDHQSVIVEWRVPNPRRSGSIVDPSSARVVLRIDQPQFNHNGGTLIFGPDNMLYVTLGDGGGSDDQGNSGDNIGHSDIGNGQDTANILGTIIRIDPTASNAPNGQYGVPVDNPFVVPEQYLAGFVGGQTGCADGTCDEIYAYGFRNGWRASFDSTKNPALIVADVGQNDIEEVDIVQAGGNYGWRIKDGGFCFAANGAESGFVTDAEYLGTPPVIDPIAQYDHDEGLSITGGFVYRGKTIRELKGHYIFGDWARSFTEPVPGRLFYLEKGNLNAQGSEEPVTILEFQLPGNPDGVGTKINGFGRDGNGEIYVIGSELGLLTGNTGRVQKLVPAR
jgi:hypothetical protein